MKKTKRISALLLALVMALSIIAVLTGCGDSTPSSEDFDFGVIRFNSKEFDAAQQQSLLIGDNLRIGQHSAADIIEPMFFGQAVMEGPYADYAFLVSQNGEFWANVNRIEAEFFISQASEGSYADDLVFFQEYIQGGGLVRNFHFWNGSENLINQIPGVEDEDDERDFRFYDVLKVVWDISEFARTQAEDPVTGINSFAEPTPEVDEDVDAFGGGLVKFGLQTRNEAIEDHTFMFNWHSVTIYVYDLDLHQSFVDQAVAARGFDVSSNTEGRVRQA